MAGGLVLLSSRPFNIGDLIESDGVTGTVEEITLNHTKVQTFDGLTVLVPNKTVSSAKLTNYGPGPPPRRLENERVLRCAHGDCQGRLHVGHGADADGAG